jgi:dTDP-4-amino-4,6-dideoxygalactose transaminase
VSDEPAVLFAPPAITDEDVEAVTRVLRSGWITTGGESRALEADLAEYLGVEHVVAVSSCTAALEIAIASLDLPAGARVGVPVWTFVSTALSVIHRGCAPVLLDVDADTLNLAPSALAAALEGGLDAVVPVHFAGLPVAREIHDMCRTAGVAVVEDAAHALGASDHRGRVAGQGSVAACLSFYATKNLTSGEGGALATDDAKVADFARSFRLHGLDADAWKRYQPGASTRYDLIGAGIKANLPDLLAALARSQLTRFDQMQTRRRQLVAHYRANLAARDGLSFVPGEAQYGSADQLVVVVLPPDTDRDAVVEALTAEGIGTSVHFPPLHHYRWISDNVATGPAGLAVADAMAPRTLSLPLHVGLTEADVDRVCDALLACLHT